MPRFCRAEALTILGEVDGVRRGAPDRHARGGETGANLSGEQRWASSRRIIVVAGDDKHVRSCPTLTRNRFTNSSASADGFRLSKTPQVEGVAVAGGFRFGAARRSLRNLNSVH